MVFGFRPIRSQGSSHGWAAALFAAYEGAPDGLDPIRFQKGLFLFVKRAGAPQRSKYRFEPYDYGPMSGAIYSDLDRLVDEGLLERVSVPGKRWSRYKPTKVTFQEGGRILEQAERERLFDAARELYEIKQDVSKMDFKNCSSACTANTPSSPSTRYSAALSEREPTSSTWS